MNFEPKRSFVWILELSVGVTSALATEISNILANSDDPAIEENEGEDSELPPLVE